MQLALERNLHEDDARLPMRDSPVLYVGRLRSRRSADDIDLDAPPPTHFDRAVTQPTETDRIRSRGIKTCSQHMN